MCCAFSFAVVAAMAGPCLFCGGASAEDQEVVYNLHFSDLHSHTSYSDGAPSPTNAHAYTRDLGADFLATTDHYYQLNDAEWVALPQPADGVKADGEFVAMASYEYQLTRIDEINVRGTRTMASDPGLAPQTYNQGTRMTSGTFLAWLYDRIAQEPDAIGQWNHPLSYGCPTC